MTESRGHKSRQIPRTVALIITAVWLLSAVSPPSANAHDPNISSIKIIYRPHDTLVSVTTHISKLFEYSGLSQRHFKVTKPIDAGTAPTSQTANPHHDLTFESKLMLSALVKQHLKLRFLNQDFQSNSNDIIYDGVNDLLVWQGTSSSTAHVCEVLSRLYPQDSASITIVAVMNDGRLIEEASLDRCHPTLVTSAGSTALDTFCIYFIAGIDHILTGADHVMFVIGLVLLGGSLTALLTTATAFTIAHSITLAVSTSGVFIPPPNIIEPLIALSIVAIGVEDFRSLKHKDVTASGELKTDSSKFAAARRTFIAFLFGLVHGFGFAGSLAEVGVPASTFWFSLVSFNLGVEIGQAIIILISVTLLNKLAKHQPAFSKTLRLVGSCLICLAGIFWFISRLLIK